MTCASPVRVRNDIQKVSGRKRSALMNEITISLARLVNYENYSVTFQNIVLRDIFFVLTTNYHE